MLGSIPSKQECPDNSKSERSQRMVQKRGQADHPDDAWGSKSLKNGAEQFKLTCPPPSDMYLL